MAREASQERWNWAFEDLMAAAPARALQLWGCARSRRHGACVGPGREVRGVWTGLCIPGVEGRLQGVTVNRDWEGACQEGSRQRQQVGHDPQGEAEEAGSVRQDSDAHGLQCLLRNRNFVCGLRRLTCILTPA